MARHENLRKLNEVVELRLKKLEEIREFLAILPDAEEQDILGIMKWWQKTAAVQSSVPTELKTRADRLFREFHTIDDANVQILNEPSIMRGRQ